MVPHREENALAGRQGIGFVIGNEDNIITYYTNRKPERRHIAQPSGFRSQEGFPSKDNTNITTESLTCKVMNGFILE